MPDLNPRSRAHRLAALPRRLVARFPVLFSGWRAAFVTLALAGTMVISAVAAWGVYDAWTEHQRALQASLDEYAKYAARTFGEQIIAEGGKLRLRAVAAVMGKSPTQPALTLSEFGLRAGQALDEVGLHDDPWRGYFRIGVRDTSYTALGAARDSTLAVVARRAVLDRWTAFDRTREPLLAIVMVNGEPVTIGMSREYDARGEPLAIFAHTQSRTLWVQILADEIFHRMPLLPPSLMAHDWTYDGGAMGSDTVVAITVLDQHGQEMYRSSPSFASEVSGEFSFRTMPGGFVVRAAILPAFVAHLVATDPLQHRRHLYVALPLLSVLLAAAAIMHLARERELVRARRDFVASVSHELRTPLAQIRMFAETLLLRRERDEQERMRWIGVIGREARRLGDLVESILLFSHIEAARIRLEPERTDLGELVEDVVEGYVPIAAARRMRLLADAPSRIIVRADPRALRQILVNLLDNALKYGPEGQTVTIEVCREGDEALMRVSDEGRGVAPADRERLWNPFVRLQHDGGMTGGSGIGLSVVRTLVEQHGGTVWVDDAEDHQGARFVVALPLDPTPGPPAPTLRTSITAEMAVPAGAGTNVGDDSHTG